MLKMGDNIEFISVGCVSRNSEFVYTKITTVLDLKLNIYLKWGKKKLHID